MVCQEGALGRLSPWAGRNMLLHPGAGFEPSRRKQRAGADAGPAWSEGISTFTVPALPPAQQAELGVGPQAFPHLSVKG